MGLYFYFHLTGYSVVRSLSEAPKYASVIANILKQAHSKDTLTRIKSTENISMQGMYMEIYFFVFFFFLDTYLHQIFNYKYPTYSLFNCKIHISAIKTLAYLHIAYTPKYVYY